MPKKSEEAILFPEQTIAGIVVKPWTFGDLFKIAEPLDRILDKLDKHNLSEKLIDAESGGILLDYFGLAKLFTIASQELLYVISITLDVDKEEIQELSISDGIQIILLMFNQNKEMLLSALKNAMSPPQTNLKKKLQEKKERGPKKKDQ